MSVAGIASAGLSQLASMQRNYQQVRGEFKQLGQDLQAGNFTQAQADFVTLSQSAASQLSGNGPVAKALNTLGQALQSGNLAAAQQAFAALPGHSVLPYSLPLSHSGARSAQRNAFSQELSQLSQALQSGNLTAAQQAFSTMQQNWQQLGSAGSLAGASAITVAPASSSGINVGV